MLSSSMSFGYSLNLISLLCVAFLALAMLARRAAGISSRATLKSSTLNARADAEEGDDFDSPTALEPCSKRPRGDERSGPHPEQACASGGSTDLNVNDLVSFLAPVGAGRVTKVRNASEGGGSDIEFDDRTMKNLESRFVRQINLGQDSTLNPGTMNVEVRSFGGLSVSLLIDVYATISDLKHEIEQYMQIPTVEQRIVVGKHSWRVTLTLLRFMSASSAMYLTCCV